MEISNLRMQAYINNALKQQQEFKATIQKRHIEGLSVARRGAQILKEQFGAERVVLFGSMLQAERIHPHSDVDLAVWGMDEKLYFKAVSRLQDINPDFRVDLVEALSAKAYIFSAIEQGVPL